MDIAATLDTRIATAMGWKRELTVALHPAAGYSNYESGTRKHVSFWDYYVIKEEAASTPYILLCKPGREYA